MHFEVYSYRFAKEILNDRKHNKAWHEIISAIEKAPSFVFPNKTSKNPNLDVVQQVLNAYFDRAFVKENGWEYHPRAVNIPDSKLEADFKKEFEHITVQAEVQFGNMSRWYGDIFKFQTAFSQKLADIGLSIVPMHSYGKRMGSNVTYFERAKKELNAAIMSITLPILLIGIYPDDKVVDISKCKFKELKDITGKGKSDNQRRIVDAYLSGVEMKKVSPKYLLGWTPNKGKQ